MNAKTISVLLTLMLSPALAFAQHEELMEIAHGIPRDQFLRVFLENNGFDENTPADKLREAVAFYYDHEEELLNGYDVNRHISLVEGVSQTRSARQAQWGQALMGILNGVGQIAERSQQQAKAEREAKQVQEEMKRQQRIQEHISANERAQEAARQYSQEAAANLHSNYSVTNSGYAGSKRDLYTSDPAWNKTADILVQQHGLEKAQQMIQQTKASNSQATQPSQSSYQTTYGTGNPDGTIMSAITTNRTMVYINVNGGSITHYATGKDSMGKYNWQYVGRTSITNINMTPYEAQFGREFSRAANIRGIGYVFFN